jgi:hypothetical protein
MDLDLWIQRWIASAKFIDRNECACVQMDKLSEATAQERKERLEKVLLFTGELPTPETTKFIEDWKVVHKVKAQEDRTFKLGQPRKQEMLSKYPELVEYMRKYNY